MGTAAAGPVILAERVVEILHNRGDDASPLWSSGSGFIMRDALVLTAAHVVGLTGELLVRLRGVEEWPARVCALPGGGPALDEELDLAVLEILRAPGDTPAVTVARLRDNPTLDEPNLDGCVAFGFPAFEQRTRPGHDRPVRESVRVDGYIPMGQGAVEGLATLRIRDAPQHPAVAPGDLSLSPWRGISGAVVFAGPMAIGVVSEHHPPAGLNGLTVVPLTWLDRRPDAAAWWGLLGVPDPASLPYLPAGAGLVSPDGQTERRYRELLLRSPEFTRLPTPFEALPASFYLPRLLRAADSTADEDDPFRTVTEVMMSVNRLVIFAPAGMGKTELLHDLVRRLAADGDVIPVFVRLHDLARRGEGRELLDFAITESFGDLLDRSEVEQFTGMLRRRRNAMPVRWSSSSTVSMRSRPPGSTTSSRACGRWIVSCSRPVPPAGSTCCRTGRPTGSTASTRRLSGISLTSGSRGIPRSAACWTVSPRTPGCGSWPSFRSCSCCCAGCGGPSRRAAGAAGLASSPPPSTRRSAGRSGWPACWPASEDVVPDQARDALQRAALEAVSTGEGDRVDIGRRHLLALMREAGEPGLASAALGFARRTGLLVPAPAGDDLRFLHQAFRAHLAGEGLVAAGDPAPAVDRLALRRNGDDTLAAAAALEPERMVTLILDRLAACRADLFRMNQRSAAACLEGLTDLRPLDDRLRPVADAVLEGAREWWSRDRFAPAIGYLRTDYMRHRLRESLGADDRYLRWAAVEGLRYLGEPEAVRAPRRSAARGALGRGADRDRRRAGPAARPGGRGPDMGALRAAVPGGGGERRRPGPSRHRGEPGPAGRGTADPLADRPPR